MHAVDIHPSGMKMPSGPTKAQQRQCHLVPQRSATEGKIRVNHNYAGIKKEAKRVLNSAQKALSGTATVLEGLSGEYLSLSAGGSPLHGLSCIENERVGVAKAFHLSLLHFPLL